jgi:lipopolysaccharide cholinephosphotransferase
MAHVIRDRTKEETLLIKKDFSELINLLNDLSINFLIDCGLLLGIHRDGDIIKWDWDIEISLIDSEFSNNLSKIIDKAKEKGFLIHKIDKKLLKLEIYKSLSYEIFSFTLKGWKHNQKSGFFVRREFEIPEKFFLNKRKIIFLNFELNCPGPIEEYLTFIYGDWKTPIRSNNIEEYVTKDFYKKESFIIKSLKILFYKIKHLYEKRIR